MPDPDRNLGRLVRRTIASSLTGRTPNIAETAKAAGMSVRTLQRRLLQDKRTYSQLLEEVRFEIARRLLSDPSVTLAKAARRLGYSDPAHFTRAFHRWAGTTPSAYRRRNGKYRR